MMRSKGVGGATAEQMRRYHEDRGPAAKAAMADKTDEDKVKRMGEAYDRNVKTYASGGRASMPTPTAAPTPTAQYAGRDPAPPMARKLPPSESQRGTGIRQQYAKGGKVRGGGCESRGKTKGKFV